jgi:uncharacterized OB-fold protein
MEKKRRCPKCGQYLEPNSGYCEWCGWQGLGININNGKSIIFKNE